MPNNVFVQRFKKDSVPNHADLLQYKADGIMDQQIKSCTKKNRELILGILLQKFVNPAKMRRLPNATSYTHEMIMSPYAATMNNYNFVTDDIPTTWAFFVAHYK